MHVLVSAMQKIRAMSMAQKKQLVDELFRAQPTMFGSFLAQQQMGVSPEKMEFLLEILLVCFQAMKESALVWPLITEDEHEKQLTRYVAQVKFGEDMPPALQQQVLKQYIESHPEQPLLAFVTNEIKDWMTRMPPQDSDKYVILTAINFVNCIAFVPMPTAVKALRKPKSR